MLGLTQLLTKDRDTFRTNPFLATVEKDSKVELFIFMTPSWPVLLYGENTPDESLIVDLINYINQKNLTISAVNAKKSLSFLFAKTFCDMNGKSYKLRMEMKLFVLKKVMPVNPCNGYLIQADADYRDTIIKWARLFNKEVKINDDESFVESHVDFIIRTGNAFLWIDKKSVCMTFRERPHEYGISIGYVYTPPDLRRKGYATNCVAQVSQRCLNDGFSYCTLFTDISNPTSNSIYQKIGYRQIGDYAIYDFLK
ncbi:MAG: GNAT family N-acetyltransferase [Candidatus Thermoplasmatota archaeon]|nr:GNAT family N-acetyltransferase [Candidatus Thermoplasmatota archaeon]